MRWIVVVFCLWASMAGAQAKDFKVRGADIGSGKPYEGRVSVTIANGVVDVVWDVGPDHYTGSGVVDGDVLAVYLNPGYSAVAVYRLNRATGAYRGKWTALGSGTVSTEDWLPLN